MCKCNTPIRPLGMPYLCYHLTLPIYCGRGDRKTIHSATSDNNKEAAFIPDEWV